MKLEVGKKYKTREGEVVTVERKVITTPHSYIGSNQCSYTERGLWLYTKHSPCDLVEEIKTSEVKLEVGKKYRTVDGTIVTVTRKTADPQYPYIVDVKGAYRWYSDAGLLYTSARCHGLNIIEEIKENTMFNKEYKYLCMDADGYNKASFNRPTIDLPSGTWQGYDLLVQARFFNLGNDWKESLREIVYNDDGSSYLRKPRYEFKVDDRVLVRNVGGDWVRRHFCCYSREGYIECYPGGKTSFTASDTVTWDEIKLYEEEE